MDSSVGLFRPFSHCAIVRPSTPNWRPNSRLTGRQLDNLAILDEPSQLLLREAMQSLGLSARAYDKVRRVSRTIADLEKNPNIEQNHVAEAIQYRLLDRQM